MRRTLAIIATTLLLAGCTAAGAQSQTVRQRVKALETKTAELETEIAELKTAAAWPEECTEATVTKVRVWLLGDHDDDGTDTLRTRTHTNELQCVGKPAVRLNATYWIAGNCVVDWHDASTYTAAEWDMTAFWSHANDHRATRSCADPAKKHENIGGVVGETWILLPSGEWQRVHERQDPSPVEPSD